MLKETMVSRIKDSLTLNDVGERAQGAIVAEVMKYG